jgi:predicted RNA-binding protein (virulence factor B family)
MTENELLGITSRLYVTKKTANGVYLSPLGHDDIRILLPKNQVPKDTDFGDILNAFVYKDSEDRFIATLTEPYVQLGGIADLTVKEVTDIGAFLDWGLVKDLLLPFKEQTSRVKEGSKVPVALYIDKSHRLCATMKLYDYLSTDSPYNKEDHVTGFIYEILDAYGAFVAVDDKYSALLPHNEITREFQIGERIEARVKEIREDGKLTLSLNEKIPLQMGVDAENVLERLTKAGGFLPFHDKTAPEIIKKEFGMSKNAYKRAIGRLMKEKKIKITPKGIEKL